MKKIVIIGGGFAGCAAAIAARKAGARVVLLERTDLLLGLGNVGGIMRNNGRYTATEENIAMGARELFDITDRYSLHTGVDFPGHRHASFFDIIQVEPAVRKLLDDMEIEVRMIARAVDVEVEDIEIEYCANDVTARGSVGKADELANDDAKCMPKFHRMKAIKLADGEWIEGSAFVETTGSSGPMGGCAEYGRGCSMCVLRCPAFGPRVSISQRAGLPDLAGKRKAGQFGAFSGSGKLEKDSLSPELQQQLKSKGVAVVPLPPEKIVREKLEHKVCQQYALDEYAENIILIDTGHAKIMTPYFPLEVLRTIPGFERARYADPYAGGKGNSIRYLSVAERDNTMRVKGFANLFCGGEKAGLFVGHTEAISTGSLAGHNAARYLAIEQQKSCNQSASHTIARHLSNDALESCNQVTDHNATRYLAIEQQKSCNQVARQNADRHLSIEQQESCSLAADGAPDDSSARRATGTAALNDPAIRLLQLPRSIAIGDLIAYGNERIYTETGLRNRYTFAGDEFFERMRQQGLYSTDADLISQRVAEAGLLGVYNRQLLCE